MITIFNYITIAFFIYGLPNMIGYFIDLRKKGAKITDPFKKMWSCFKCVSFWTTLIITGGNFIMACNISFIGYLIDKYIINRF